MKTITGFALGLATALAVPLAFADDDTTTKSTTTTTTQSATTTDSTTSPTQSATTTDSTTSPTTESYSSTGSYGYAAPAAATTTTTTSTTDDYYVHDPKKDDNRPHVRRGLGLNVFGAAGTKDTARFGLGGRLEYVLPFGLAIGGSYTQHFESEGDRTAVRPLLGEVGWAIPVFHHVEVRPMVGLGYAFATASSGGTTNNTGTSAQTASTSGTASVGGFDVAPGAKVSYVARAFEVFTMPKYHFISGNNFLGVEVGAGARF